MKLVSLFIILFSFTVLGSNTRIVKMVDLQKKVIAITLDDGPVGNLTPKILKLLKEEQLKVTFFVVGDLAKQHKELIKKAIIDGHEIANHGMNFTSLDKQTPKQLESEIGAMQKLCQQEFGITPKLYRAAQLRFSKNILDYCQQNNLSPVSCSISARDWAKGTQKSEVIKLATEKAHAGAILLLHERPWTLEALPEIIKFYKEAGYEFKTVSELISMQGEAL